MLNERELNVIRVVLFFIVVITWGMFLTGCTSPSKRRIYEMHKFKSFQHRYLEELNRGRLKLRRGPLYIRPWLMLLETPRTRQMLLRLHWRFLRFKKKRIPLEQLFSFIESRMKLLEVVKYAAPAIITTLGTVAVAGYQASVSKNNSDNAARVAIGDATTDASIMQSVTNMASVGLSRDTLSVGGDYTTAGNDMDQSVSTSSTQTSSVATTTSTTTSTTSDSNNQTTYTTTEGTNVDLADIEALLGAGIRVTVIIDGEEVEVTQCEDTLTFGGGC